MQINIMLKGEGGVLFNAKLAIQKPTGLVILGKATNGTLKEGGYIFFDNNFYDKIVRIEHEHQKIVQATPGEEVGICLKYMNRERLIEFLGLPIK